MPHTACDLKQLCSMAKSLATHSLCMPHAACDLKQLYCMAQSLATLDINPGSEWVTKYLETVHAQQVGCDSCKLFGISNYLKSVRCGRLRTWRLCTPSRWVVIVIYCYCLVFQITWKVLVVGDQVPGGCARPAGGFECLLVYLSWHCKIKESTAVGDQVIKSFARPSGGLIQVVLLFLWR